VQLAELENVTQVACGANHTLALKGDGSVYSFGLGEQGQLGRGVVRDIKNAEGEYDLGVIAQHMRPAAIEGLEPARTIGCGAYHSLAVSSLRCQVFACGLNQYRQVSELEGDVVPAMKRIAALDGLHVAQVDGGEHYSVARTAAGLVYAWGRSDQSQLGVRCRAWRIAAAAAGEGS
jgi:regulator of chromosome condensation